MLEARAGAPDPAADPAAGALAGVLEGALQMEESRAARRALVVVRVESGLAEARPESRARWLQAQRTIPILLATRLSISPTSRWGRNCRRCRRAPRAVGANS